MQYKKTDNVIIVRLDPKEEILSSLRKIAERENIRLAEVSAIGATCEFTAGVYDLKEKVFNLGLFAPYLERACIRLATPAVSSVPLMMW